LSGRVQRWHGSLATGLIAICLIEGIAMRYVPVLLAAATVILALAPVARAADGAQPEIQRAPGSGSAQPVGQVHTLRNIPEACVRLEGQFTGDGAAPYRFEAVKRDPCVQRAVYADAAKLKAAPSVKSGWILNDRISVPRADAPACIATVEVWRHTGDTAPPKLDAQGRSRLYLDKPQQAVAVPMFAATLAIDARTCK